MNVEVVLSPLLLKKQTIEEKIVVVIDVLRATSTICTALANGALSVIPALTVEEALSYKVKGYITGAERDGTKVEGFDLGNSPREYSREAVNDRHVVLTTTNGTRCIRMSGEADTVLIGSFLNLSAISKYLINAQKDIVLFCAGWKDKVNMEDALYAGAVLDELGNKASIRCDAAEMMLSLYTCVKDDIRGYLTNASHAMRFERLGIAGDIDYCIQVDSKPVLPVLQTNRIVLL